MFGTGARISEAVALTWADIDLHKRAATIRQTKVEDTPAAHLPAPLVASLANIPSNRNAHDKVFGYAGTGSVKQPWHNVIARAGIERLTSHCCRHGFATTLLEAGKDVKTIAKLGRWKDAATVLKTYAHALDDPAQTDVIFDRNLAQSVRKKFLTESNKRKITSWTMPLFGEEWPNAANTPARHLAQAGELL